MRGAAGRGPPVPPGAVHRRRRCYAWTVATTSRATRRRARRAGLALAGGAWALLTLPLVAIGWSWPWVDAVGRAEPYRSIRDALPGDAYAVGGSLAAIAFLAIGLALLPDLRRAGWGGRALAWLIIAGAAVSPLSYLGSPEESPLHALWGSEAYLLLAIGAAGVAAACTAGRSWPRWSRLLLAATPLVLVAGAAALGYYPHGCLAALAIEAAVLVLRAPADRPASAA